MSGKVSVRLTNIWVRPGLFTGGAPSGRLGQAGKVRLEANNNGFQPFDPLLERRRALPDVL